MKNKLLPLALLLFGSAAYSQVGIGNLAPNNSTQLEISATDKGVLIPRITLLSRDDVTTITPGNVNSLLVYNTTDNELIKPGYYYWYQNKWQKLANSSDLEDIKDQNLGEISLVVVGTNLVLTDIHGNSTTIPILDLNIITSLVDNGSSFTYTNENNYSVTIDLLTGPQGIPGEKGDKGDVGETGPQGKNSLVNYFYAPSIVLPTTDTNLPSYVTYSNGIFTTNLYQIYTNQFSMLGNQPGSNRTAIKNPTATNLPVFQDLEYFITYFDNTVFDPITITISNEGILTYEILNNAIVSEKTYMNIVFKIKDETLVNP